MADITIVNGVYKPTYNWGAPSCMVGGFNPSEKYESQMGLLFPIYGKIKIIFQATNQDILTIVML